VKRFAQVLLMVVLGGGATWLVFRDVEWDLFWEELTEVNLPTFLAGLALFLGLHISRSVRWGRLVQAVEPKVRFRSYFSICSVGFFLINVLPFRLGEFVRPYLLLDREDVPFGSGMATVLVERVLDVAALGLLFIGVLLWGIDDLDAGSIMVEDKEYDLVGVGRTAILAALIPFGGAIFVLLLLGERGVALGRRISGVFGARISDLVGGFLTSFLQAVRSLGSTRALVSQTVWTLSVWGINAASMWIMATAFPFGAGMGFWDGATILVCLCIVLIVPPPPGFAGVFEFAVAVAVVGIYGQTMSTAAAFAVMVHVCQFTLLAILGITFLTIDRISLRRLLDEMKKLRAAPPPAEAST
jgi:glycosyltransferase 2 family protein